MSHHASGPDFGFPHGDARLDMTDLYAFPKPGDPNKSILILNVHPSVAVNPPGPTTTEPFAPGALYEFKIDTDGDAIADICYSVQFRTHEDGKQAATLRRVQGEQAAEACADGEVIVGEAPVSHGKEALVTNAGDYRFFAGWRSDPSFSMQTVFSIKCSSRHQLEHMGQRSQGAWRESCSPTFFPTTLGGQHAFHATAGRSATTLWMFCSQCSPRGK
jgi:hypothetical protein